MAKVELMKKSELVEIVKEALDLKTKTSANEFIENLDRVIEAVVETLDANTGVKLGSYVRVENVIQDEKKIPERTLHGKTFPAHVAPAKEVIKVKGTSLVKKMK